MKKNVNLKSSTSSHVMVSWHMWLIGLFFLFIYSYGIYDYFMMLGHNIDYYNSKNYGEAVMEYFTNYPIVFKIFWITNLITGLISPILLLIRNRWAVLGSLLSAISLLCLQGLTFSLRNRWNVLGPYISMFDIFLLIITCGFFLYCRVLAKKGVLK